jgi:hypothetical protein
MACDLLRFQLSQDALWDNPHGLLIPVCSCFTPQGETRKTKEEKYHAAAG